MNTSNDDPRQQFLEWLPYYVNSRLDDDQRGWMDKYLSEHPEAIADLHIQQLLRSELRSGMPASSPDQGLSNLMGRIRREQPETKTLSNRLQEILKGFTEGFTTPHLRPAWAIMSALLLVQAVSIGILVHDRNESATTAWRSAAPPPAVSGPILQITFKPTASEEAIRLLLQKIQGKIVGGPGMLGHYLVKVPDNVISTSAHDAEQSQQIESVRIINEIPPED